MECAAASMIGFPLTDSSRAISLRSGEDRKLSPSRSQPARVWVRDDWESPWLRARLLALRPGCLLLRATDIPIGTAALQHGAQVKAQLLHRRPAEEPVAIVDLADTQL